MVVVSIPDSGLAGYHSILDPVYEALERRGFEVTTDPVLDGNPVFTVSPITLDSAILLPHGVGDIDVCKYVKSHFVSGKYFEMWARILLLEEAGEIKPDQIKVTGWPKLDILFQPEKKVLFEKFAEKYSLYDLPYDKTVLYAPTASDGNLNSFDVVIDSLIESVNKQGMNLCIKPHDGGDVIEQGRSVWGQWTKVEPIKEKISNMLNIQWISSTENITLIYPFIDILISDVSSCLREFMVMDKPSIQIDSLPFIGFRPPRIFEGMIHTQSTQLDYTLERVLHDLDMRKEERRAWKELIFGKTDGHAADRIVDTMIEIMEW